MELAIATNIAKHAARICCGPRVCLGGKLLRWGVTFSDTLCTISKNNTETKTPRFMCDHIPSHSARAGGLAWTACVPFWIPKTKKHVVYDYIWICKYNISNTLYPPTPSIRSSANLNWLFLKNKYFKTKSQQLKTHLSLQFRKNKTTSLDNKLIFRDFSRGRKSLTRLTPWTYTVGYKWGYTWVNKWYT